MNEIDEKINEYKCKYGVLPKKIYLDNEHHLKLQQMLAATNSIVLKEYKGNILGIKLTEYKGIEIQRIEKGLFVS